MLEADGYDPNLPLHSGPTLGPHVLEWGLKHEESQGRSQRGSKPHGSMPRGGNAMEASQYYTRLTVEGGHLRVHSSEFFALRSKRSPGS